MTMIIFEGCDCVGKTTAIEALKPLGNYTVKKFSAPPKMEPEKAMNWCKEQYFSEVDFMSYWWSRDADVIYDRYYFGEQIYAPVYRGYSPDYMADLEEELNRVDAVLVLLTAPADIVKQRFDGQFIKETDIPKLLDDYNKAWEASTMKHKLRIDTSKMTPNQIAAFVHNKILNIKEQLKVKA